MPFTSHVPANNLSPQTNTGIGIFFAKTSLAYLSQSPIMRQLVSTTYEVQLQKEGGDMVVMHDYVPPVVNNWVDGQVLTYPNIQINHRFLNMTENKLVEFGLPKVFEKQAPFIGDIKNYMPVAASAFRTVVENYLFATMQNGTPLNDVNTPLTVDLSNIEDIFGEAISVLVRNNANNANNVKSGSGRGFIVVPIEIAMGLSKKRMISQTPAGDKARGAGSSLSYVGDFGMHGFDVYVTNSSAPINGDIYPVLVGYKYATEFAVQINSARYIQQLESQIKAGGSINMVYGASVAKPEAICTMFLKRGGF